MRGLDKQYFIVGDLSASLDTQHIQAIDDADELNNVKDGTWISRWGNLMEWGPGSIRPSELEKLRHQGDPLCDAVVRFFGLKAGDDGLKRLDDYISTHPKSEWNADVAAFWEEMARDPPEGVCALRPSAAYLCARTQASLRCHTKFIDSERDTTFEQEKYLSATDKDRSDISEKSYSPDGTMLERNRRPLPILSQGQAVFWRYSNDMFMSLLHYSLAGGFASARIMSVLHETGYLTSSSRDATYRRLMETTQAIVDFMGDMTPVTGRGWKSAIRVRMLHSQVRIRILARQSKLKTYDVEKDGIPINQEDLLATLGSFSLAPLWCQKRLGIILTVEEELAFIAAWRHVGYYLGISPGLLSTFYNTDNPRTTSSSHRFFACIAMHLYASPIPPKDPFSTATYKVLHAVAHRPPSDKATLYHCEMSRMLLGPGLANQLGIPRGSLKDRLQVKQHAWNSWITARFSRSYLGRWEIQRQALFRRVITLIIAWQLGNRRSRFTWKDEKDHDKKISELLHDEAGEPPGLDMGIAVGKEVRSHARWLFGEMGCVLAGIGLLSVLAVWQTAKIVMSNVI